MPAPHPEQALKGLQNNATPSSIQGWPHRPPKRHLSFSSDPLDLDFCKLRLNTRKDCFYIHRKWTIVMSEETQVVGLSNLPNLISFPALSCFRRARCHKCLISIIKVSNRQYRPVPQRQRWLFSYIWVADCGTCGHMISEPNHTRNNIKILVNIQKKQGKRALCMNIVQHYLSKTLQGVLNFVCIVTSPIVFGCSRH